ncbi:vam6/Vps39-like protein [Styela clava]
MHDAYIYLPVLKSLPLAIECIACWGEEKLFKQNRFSINDGDVSENDNSAPDLPKATLLVGTKPGHLLVYSVEHNPNVHNRAEVKLERSNRTFSKKPIQQLFVCVELKLILSLSDSMVSVHDLTTFQLITTLQKSKGAACFSADLESRTSSQGETAHTLRLCIAVKRKLLLYFWKNRSFHELCPDISMPEIPKCMAWCRDSVCLGFRREYFMVTVKANSVPYELFPTGKLMEPVMTKLDENRLILMKDDMSIFIDKDGTGEKQVFKWSDAPIDIETQAPYILAVLPSYVEIRTLEPRLQIQNFELPKPRFITKWKEWIFVASLTHVWGLVQVPIADQIKQLLLDKQFELALRLAEMIEEDEIHRSRRIKHIQNLLAFELFCQGRFEESLKNFSKLGTDPAQVIGLYPDLLPDVFRSTLTYPSDTPDLKGSQLERGLLALIEYLTEKRNETMMENELPPATPIVEGNKIIRSKDSLLKIIDTTLLKCYLKTNDALLAPLLRLPDNYCHVEECERVLKKAQKYRELIILYRKKDLHRKALNLLVSQKVDPVIEAHKATIEYLQHLGKNHLELVFEFAPWVFKVDQEDGLRIFTDDITEVESLPRKQVYEFLESQSDDLAIKYLEHVIFNAEDKTPEFHNNLVIAYKIKVQNLLALHQHELPEVDKYSMNSGPPELREMRKKLLSLLESSTSYQAERLIEHFKSEVLVEEKAIILGRMGLHEQALAIYAQTLRDPSRAEEYCHKVYELNKIMNKDVFLCLLKMYLNPHIEDEAYDGDDSVKPDMKAAFRVLEQHSNKIDCVQALNLLPNDTDIRQIKNFLENVLEKLNERHREAQVLESLMLSEKYQVHEQRMYHESKKCVISDEKLCRVCKKRIGDSAFARYPNGVVVHYFCCKDRTVVPQQTS